MKKKQALDDDFGAVLNCAVLYCIGRQTYMPGLVTDWIMSNCDGKLTARTISLMKQDIDHPLYGSLGADCDIRTWMVFRRWLDEQENETQVPYR